MKNRTSIYTLLSILFAVSVLASATAFQTGYKTSPSDWVHAHLNAPGLWITDICVIFALVWMSSYARADGMVRLQAAELRRLQEEYQKQLEQMISATEELGRQNEEMDNQNSEYSERIAQLERETLEKETAFEMEARRLTEQTFHALQGQIEANSRQMEAVNMAMQYQRAGLQQLGNEIKVLSKETMQPLPMLTTSHAESPMPQLESGDKDPEWNEFFPDEAVVSSSTDTAQILQH